MILDSTQGHMEASQGQILKLEDYLPGIGEFLFETLSNETLSSTAEAKRQYFIERIKVLRLHPTVPPRPKRAKVITHSDPGIINNDYEEEKPSSTGPTDDPSRRESDPVIIIDFAAQQRALSRSLAHKEESDSDVNDGDDEEDEEEDEEIKLYDDIELEDSDVSKTVSENDRDLYEVPITQASQDNLDSAGMACTLQEPTNHVPLTVTISSPPDLAESMTVATSTPLPDNIESPRTQAPGPPLSKSLSAISAFSHISYDSAPPPLPPRRERKSVDSVISATSDMLSVPHADPAPLPIPDSGPPVTAWADVKSMSERSDRSEKSEAYTDVTDNETGTSYESYDDVYFPGKQSTSQENRHDDPDIKLPLNKKKKKHKAKFGSSNQLDSSDMAFKQLKNISIVGELMYHGKLTWTRKLAAVSQQYLICYKPDKLSKPTMCISLPGYQAETWERENKKGFEIGLCHATSESYLFSVEYCDWAQSWCEYIQAAADEKPAPGYPLRLYRHSGSSAYEVQYCDVPLAMSSSKSSLTSAPESPLPVMQESAYGPAKNHDSNNGKGGKRTTLADRATRLFESFGKKKGARTKTLLGVSSLHGNPDVPEKSRSPSCASTSSGGTTTPQTPTAPLQLEDMIDSATSDDKHDPNVHKGYMNIFSTFNRRSWGKWLCVITGNTFECYRSDKSKVCDLTFPLNECTIRHAQVETKSERGIMILKNDIEKVTVEPLTTEDLVDWLKILMRETITGCVPEGLEGFYAEKEYEIPCDDTSLEQKGTHSDDAGYSTIQELDSVKYFSIDEVESVDEGERSALYTPVRRESRSRSSLSSAVFSDSHHDTSDVVGNNDSLCSSPPSSAAPPVPQSPPPINDTCSNDVPRPSSDSHKYHLLEKSPTPNTDQDSVAIAADLLKDYDFVFSYTGLDGQKHLLSSPPGVEGESTLDTTDSSMPCVNSNDNISNPHEKIEDEYETHESDNEVPVRPSRMKKTDSGYNTCSLTSPTETEKSLKYNDIDVSGDSTSPSTPDDIDNNNSAFLANSKSEAFHDTPCDNKADNELIVENPDKLDSSEPKQADPKMDFFIKKWDISSRIQNLEAMAQPQDSDNIKSPTVTSPQKPSLTVPNIYKSIGTGAPARTRVFQYNAVSKKESSPDKELYSTKALSSSSSILSSNVGRNRGSKLGTSSSSSGLILRPSGARSQQYCPMSINRTSKELKDTSSKAYTETNDAPSCSVSEQNPTPSSHDRVSSDTCPDISASSSSSSPPSSTNNTHSVDTAVLGNIADISADNSIHDIQDEETSIQAVTMSAMDRMDELTEEIKEQRRYLIEVKTKRIRMRDKRLKSTSDEERVECKDKFQEMEGECRDTEDKILLLERELRRCVEHVPVTSL